MERPVGSCVADRASPQRSALRLVASNGAESGPPSAAGGYPAPVKATALTLEHDATLDDTIARMLGACLDHFAANWPALRDSSHPESIHQLRVALRRLRAGAGLLKRAVHCPEFATAAARAKAIAAVLGEAREWDVFREMLETGPAEPLRGEPSFYALLDQVERRRALAHEKARATIADATTKRFVGDLRGALTRKVWRDATFAQDAGARQGAGRTGAAGSARDFAVRALDRLHRRAAGSCKRLASQTAEQRHAARIALKKVRYAAEFFESLFEERSGARTYLRSLAKIQDSLGAENDMAAATRLLDEIDAANGGTATLAAGFVRGWCAHARKQGAARTGKSAKAVRKLQPFWR